MNAAIYRILLRLYPADLRERWGEEMVDTFALQLDDGWFDAWSCALTELLRVALPLQARRDGVVIPVVALAGSGTLLFALTWALGNSIAMLSLYHRLIEKLGG